MDRDIENQTLVFPTGEYRDQDKMGRTRNRQKFRKTLQQSQDHRVTYIHLSFPG
jgi:hypothetical protein